MCGRGSCSALTIPRATQSYQVHCVHFTGFEHVHIAYSGKLGLKLPSGKNAETEPGEPEQLNVIEPFLTLPRPAPSLHWTRQEVNER